MIWWINQRSRFINYADRRQNISVFCISSYRLSRAKHRQVRCGVSKQFVDGDENLNPSSFCSPGQSGVPGGAAPLVLAVRPAPTSGRHAVTRAGCLSKPNLLRVPLPPRSVCSFNKLLDTWAIEI